MVNYANGKIYKLLNTIDDEVYVGSTTQSLSKRLSWHKGDCNKASHGNSRVYAHMRELGVDKFYIELIEDYPCSNNTMLTAREGVYIREIGTLNTFVAGRTWQERYQDNAERIKERQAKYYAENVQKIKEQKAEYLKNNPEKRKETMRKYQERNKDEINRKERERYENNKEKEKVRKAKYYTENAGRLREQKAKYRAENKEKLKAKIMCECGCELRRDSLSNHKKTQKHKNLMEQLEQLILEDEETNIEEQE